MSQKTEYKDTVFLPRTDFPMKAGLAAKEPAILARWEKERLYEQLRQRRAGAERFILHDGPPYANGDLHMGHAMNKILKDIVVRSRSLMGFDAPYVPGWDCHGLPIEWKVEEQYRKKKLDKDAVPPREFRAECRAYAEKWVDVQRDQFRRLGVMGEWEKPYLTMDFEAEAAIVAELLKFADSDQLYRGAKPVMWSPVEKTALAEAEVEYEDIVSTQIDVGFEIIDSPVPDLIGAYALIWTTTPWTIPVNQALAFGPDISYVLAETAPTATHPARRILIAKALVEAVGQRLGGALKVLRHVETADLPQTAARHPMHERGGFFAVPRPFLPGEFVTTEAGTGLVHMAPDHGEDDFILCKTHAIEPVFAVADDGRYREDWLWLGGQGSVINAKFNAPDGAICSDLDSAGGLFAASSDFQHSYPHSWRSKAKIIFRCTPQWFIAMDRPIGSFGGQMLRSIAIDAIERTQWVPARSKNRIEAMVEGRPDWVISRQRAWGVPIALYLNRRTGDYLKDPAVNARIVDAFRAGGADAWFMADHQSLLGNEHSLADYDIVTDILDVWFDSGSTHSYVVEARYGEGKRADLYLEGSDQHRGWFQSSLLESCGTRGQAPYEAVLTHGFALDQNGRKMSKSVGNAVDPIKVIDEAGADILRLWVASTDYFEDVRIGKEVLSGTSDAYRKLRNTFRYLLGALDGYSDRERVEPKDMPELERWVLHRLAELDGELRAASEAYEYNRYTRLIAGFANDDLSAFFFDIRKDSLYCDAPGSAKRRAYRTVLDQLFQALVRWISPILCFTAEEVWMTRYPEAESIHLETWPDVDRGWLDAELGQRWEIVRTIRADVFAKLEQLRRDKVIGSSLEARVRLLLDGNSFARTAGIDWAETLIVGSADAAEDRNSGLAQAVSVLAEVERTLDEKCERCWRHLPDVQEDRGLCGRCSEVLDGKGS
ncbi:MAG TPA: isoleucine--tRNA ligase [Allosphingosinicella sp.]|nr:isoleucine--tRNA ligase [Allosphingosinicella sp.]